MPHLVRAQDTYKGLQKKTTDAYIHRFHKTPAHVCTTNTDINIYSNHTQNGTVLSSRTAQGHQRTNSFIGQLKTVASNVDKLSPNTNTA